MTEYQIFNMMYVGFISNSMYFVGMVLLTWLGFRMANNIYNSSDANMSAKVLTSAILCACWDNVLLYTANRRSNIRAPRLTSLSGI